MHSVNGLAALPVTGVAGMHALASTSADRRRCVACGQSFVRDSTVMFACIMKS